MSLFGGLFGKNDGALESKILETELSTGLKFPEAYRKFLSKSDGVFFKKQSIKIFSLKESVEYFEKICKFGLTKTWGYFPVLDNNDSNPWCICCRPPLTGYIVHVFHDDSAQIGFRSIENFLAKIQSGPADDVLFLDHPETDFQSNGRTSHDIETAQDLIKNILDYKDIDRNDACRFAMWLFGDEQVDQIAAFLEDEDPYIARDASDRLKAMQSQKSNDAIQTSRKNLAAFIAKAVALLTQAGIQAASENESIVRIHPENIALDMKVFYSQRNKPDAEQKFVERVKFFIASKHKK